MTMLIDMYGMGWQGLSCIRVEGDAKDGLEVPAHFLLLLELLTSIRLFTGGAATGGVGRGTCGLANGRFPALDTPVPEE